jgi:hypothetical protein
MQTGINTTTNVRPVQFFDGFDIELINLCKVCDRQISLDDFRAIYARRNAIKVSYVNNQSMAEWVYSVFEKCRAVGATNETDFEIMRRCFDSDGHIKGYYGFPHDARDNWQNLIAVLAGFIGNTIVVPLYQLGYDREKL